MAIVAGLITAAAALWGAPSAIFMAPGLQYVVSIAIGLLAIRICVAAGWQLGQTFAGPRTAGAVAIAAALAYTTMIAGLVVRLVEG